MSLIPRLVSNLIPRPHTGIVKVEGAWYLFLCAHDVKTSTKREHVVLPTIICSMLDVFGFHPSSSTFTLFVVLSSHVQMNSSITFGIVKYKKDTRLSLCSLSRVGEPGNEAS